MLELADAVVIGGGILGVSVAEALSRRLPRVLLLEADRCGGRATAGGFAWVNASSKWLDEAYHRLNAEACRRHLALATQWDARRTGWNGGGTLFWACQSDNTEMASLESRAQALMRWNYPVARVNCGEMRALEPFTHFPDDAAGLFAPSEGWVNTARIVRFYTEQIREHHSEIAEFTRGIGFTFDHQGAVSSVETTRGRVATRTAVLCAGIETHELAQHVLPNSLKQADRLMTQSPGYLLETGQLPANGRVHRVCCPAGPGGLHLRPTPDGGLLVGADDADVVDANRDHGQTRDPLISPSAGTELDHSLLARVGAILPDLPRGAATVGRRCIRPIPADGKPIVGPLPACRGVFLLASHSGVTLAPLLSELLAEEILTGRESPWLAAYRPARLITQ